MGSQCSGISIRLEGGKGQKRGLGQGQGSGNSMGLGVTEPGRGNGRISGLEFRRSGEKWGVTKGLGRGKGGWVTPGHRQRSWSSRAIPVRPSQSQCGSAGPISASPGLALCHPSGPSHCQRGPSRSIPVSPSRSQRGPAQPHESRSPPVRPSWSQFVPVPPQRPRPRSPQSRGLLTPRPPALIGGLACQRLLSHWLIHLSLNVTEGRAVRLGC